MSEAAAAAASRVGGWFRPRSITGVPPRPAVAAIALLAAAIVIGVLSILLPYGGFFATLLFEHTPASPFPYPFTIQNLLHVLFFLALGELFVRSRTARWERRQIAQHFLPEDESTVLQIDELGPIRRRVAHRFDGQNGFIASLIDIAVLQLQSTRSIDQAVSVLSTTLQLMGDRVDHRYSLVRYLSWVIPTLGFVGTVTHLGQALRLVDPAHMNLGTVTTALAVAFNTTLVALLESAVIVLFQTVIQAREEGAVTEAGEYCLRNLINRLFVK